MKIDLRAAAAGEDEKNSENVCSDAALCFKFQSQINKMVGKSEKFQIDLMNDIVYASTTFSLVIVLRRALDKMEWKYPSSV